MMDNEPEQPMIVRKCVGCNEHFKVTEEYKDSKFCSWECMEHDLGEREIVERLTTLAKFCMIMSKIEKLEED